MNNKDICLLPWVEMHINASGQLKTCCAQFDFLENNEGKALYDSFNGAAFSKIRKQFLAGETPEVCKACLGAESQGLSYKTVKSPLWSQYSEELLKSDKALPIRFLDIRFGNLCNFSCRTCDSLNSSRWESIDSIVGRKTIHFQRVSKETLREQIFNTLDNVEEIYFAGGEPLLNEEHYLVLEEIIRRKRTSIKITYNTNLSLLKAFGRDVTQLWDQLEDVSVYPSVDSIAEQGEYIRTGFKWKQFEENFHKIKKYVKCLNSVLSAYNVFSICDLITWANKNNSSLFIFPAYHPVEISAAALPLAVRQQAADKMEKLIQTISFDSWQAAQISTAIQYLRNEKSVEKTENFVQFNKKLDEFHRSDFFKTFPEHQSWAEEYTR